MVLVFYVFKIKILAHLLSLPESTAVSCPRTETKINN